MKKIKRALLVLLFLTIALFGYMKFSGGNINEIGLKVLSWIKKIQGKSVNFASFDKEDVAIIDHHDWTLLLSKYVTDAGAVDYKGFVKDKDALEKYLETLSNNPPGSNWSKEDKLAFWINAYNAFTVKLIADHYPVKSIKDIAGGLPMINSPWDIKFFKIGETEFDLNTIEHEILRKQFEEPRIHFAINCASFSCPKLRNKAFEAGSLETQLKEQARSFINNTDKNIITDEEIKLSKIFSWFESDFTKGGTVTSFIQQYHPEINVDLDIGYMEYDWTLNE